MSGAVQTAWPALPDPLRRYVIDALMQEAVSYDNASVRWGKMAAIPATERVMAIMRRCQQETADRAAAFRALVKWLNEQDQPERDPFDDRHIEHLAGSDYRSTPPVLP